jgi:hypothetical protein
LQTFARSYKVCPRRNGTASSRAPTRLIAVIKRGIKPQCTPTLNDHEQKETIRRLKASECWSSIANTFDMHHATIANRRPGSRADPVTGPRLARAVGIFESDGTTSVPTAVFPWGAHLKNPAQLQLGRQLWPLCDQSNHERSFSNETPTHWTKTELVVGATRTSTLLGHMAGSSGKSWQVAGHLQPQDLRWRDLRQVRAARMRRRQPSAGASVVA